MHLLNNKEVTSSFTRPVWAEISCSRLFHNFHTLQSLATPDLALMAVIKANAYGHGIELCAPWLVEAGAEWLGVTSVEEGVAVRALCLSPRIFIMSSLWQGEAEAVLKHRLTPAVWESFHLRMLTEAAEQSRLPRQSVPVHLEIDTGMSRQGVRWDQISTELLHFFGPSSPLYLEAVMTHFHSPEELDSDATFKQISRFEIAVDKIFASGLSPTLLHAGNSATVITGHGLDTLRALAARHQTALMLRTGIALYGYTPGYVAPASAENAEASAEIMHPFRPVLSLKSRIVSLRTILQDDTAGYNATFHARSTTRLALLPIGYADGLSRLLSNRGWVLIRGQRCPIVGRISMDQTIVDVTAIPNASIGDEVVLLGEQGSEHITAQNLANLCQTIPWEILTSLAHRIPHITTK